MRDHSKCLNLRNTSEVAETFQTSTPRLLSCLRPLQRLSHTHSALTHSCTQSCKIKSEDGVVGLCVAELLKFLAMDDLALLTSVIVTVLRYPG